jgi:hypothetical protein
MRPHRLLALALVAACEGSGAPARLALLGELQAMLRTRKTWLGLCLEGEDIALVRDAITLIEGTPADAESGELPPQSPARPAKACRRRW